MISNLVHISFTFSICNSTFPFYSIEEVSPSRVIITKFFYQFEIIPLFLRIIPEQTLMN